MVVTFNIPKPSNVTELIGPVYSSIHGDGLDDIVGGNWVGEGQDGNVVRVTVARRTTALIAWMLQMITRTFYDLLKVYIHCFKVL